MLANLINVSASGQSVKPSTPQILALASLILASFAGGALQLSSRTYVIKSQYIAYGSGVLTSEVLSHHMLLAPTIPHLQERLRAELFVNRLPASFEVKLDAEGNEYADPGPLSYSGFVNVTLIQEVRVWSPPFRARLAQIPEARWEEQRGKLPRNSFWRCNATKAKFSDVERLSWELRASSNTPRQYLLNVIRWAAQRVQYSENVKGGVKCPALFLESLSGACGDIHAFIAALLMVQGIDASLVYALVAEPSAAQELTSQSIAYSLRGATPHIFLVANLSGQPVPVDLTASLGDRPEDKVLGASVSVLDSVIILYRVRDSDPNDYLLVYSLPGAEKVEIRYQVEEVPGEEALRWLVILTGAATLAILLALYAARSPRE